MQAIIQEAIIEEVKKRPLLCEDFSSEATDVHQDVHQFLWEEVFTAVVPNWSLLNWEKKGLIGRKIKRQWLLLKEKVSCEPEQKAETETMKTGDSEDVQEHSEGVQEHSEGVQEHSEDVQEHSEDVQEHSEDVQGHSEDVQGHSEDVQGHKRIEHSPDMEMKRQSQRSNNHFGGSAGNLRDQRLDPEEDLIETFNRVLKTASSKAVDSRRTKSYQFNRNKNISSTTQSNSKPCIIKDKFQLIKQPESSNSRSNNEVDSRSTISKHFNPNRNTSSATHKHNSHFKSRNTETKVTHSYSASRMSISSHSASRNTHSPIQSLGATSPPFIAPIFPPRLPKCFQRRRPNHLKTFCNPRSRRKLYYPRSDELKPSASDKWKRSSYFPQNPSIHFTLPHPSSTTDTLDSSQSQIISDNSALNPYTSLNNPPYLFLDTTKSYSLDYSLSEDPQNYSIPPDSSNLPRNLDSSNPINYLPISEDAATTDLSNPSENLPNPYFSDPSNSCPSPHTQDPQASLHQWNALPEPSNLPYFAYPHYAFPAVDQYNQFYPPNEIGYFPSPNPYNYYCPFSNQFPPCPNPYHPDFQIPYWHPLSVKIPIFNDDGSITFTSDTGDQDYFHNT